MSFRMRLRLQRRHPGRGRRTGKSAIGAYTQMHPKFKFLGILTFIVPVIIMTCYAVIGGRITKYAVLYLTGQAQATIRQRMQDALGTVNAAAVLAAGVSQLQSLGMTFRKAEYITDFAAKVQSGAFEIDAVAHMSDADAIRALSSLKGIGVWTAEMILLFCLQRPDIFSFDDLAILRGLRMLYRHKETDRARFEAYRRRFSPYGSVANLYLWAIAGGALPERKAPKPKEKKKAAL